MEKNKVIAKSIVINNWEIKIFWLLLTVVALLFFVQLFFISTSILSVVARQKNEDLIASKETELTSLVTDYFIAFNEIDKQTAYKMGFRPIEKQMIFVDRINNNEQFTLSLLNNEI